MLKHKLRRLNLGPARFSASDRCCRRHILTTFLNDGGLASGRRSASLNGSRVRSFGGPSPLVPCDAPVYGAIVILIAAKDLVWKCDATETLRCAQDDRCFAGP
jgi:hypothetical protein